MADTYKVRIEGSGGEQAAGEIRKVEEAAKQLGETTKGVALGSFLGGFASGAAQEARGQLKELVVQAIDLADRLDDLSAKAGVSASKLQMIGNAASLNGGSFEGVAAAMAILQKNAALAASGNEKLRDSFDRLGVSAADLSSLSPDEVMLKLADGVSSATDRSRAFADVLGVAGRGAGDLFATLEQGRGKIEEVGTAMGVFSDKTTAELARAKDEWTKFGNKVTIVTGTAVSDYLKAIDKMGGGVEGWAKLQGEALVNPIMALKRLVDAHKEAAQEAEVAANKQKSAATSEEEQQQILEDQAAAFKAVAAAAKEFADQQAALEAGTAWMRQENPQLKTADAAAAKIRTQIALENAKAAGKAEEVAQLERQLAIDEEVAKLEAAGIVTGGVALALATELVDAKEKAKTKQEGDAKAAKDAADAAEREAAAREKMARQAAQQKVSAAEEALAAAQAGTSKVAVRKAQQGLNEAKQFEKLIGEGVAPDEAAKRAKSFAANVAKKARRDSGMIGGPEEAPIGGAGDITGGGRFDSYGNRMTAPKVDDKGVAPAAAALEQGAQALDASATKTASGAQNLNSAVGGLNSAIAGLNSAANALLNFANNLEARLATLENRSGS